MCNSVAQNSHKTTCFVVVFVRFIGPMCVRAECVPFGNTKPNILHCTYLHSRPLAKRNIFEKSDEERKNKPTTKNQHSKLLYSNGCACMRFRFLCKELKRAANYKH